MVEFLISLFMIAQINVTFRIDAPNAKEVFLAGEFNSWSSNTLPMHKKEGIWQVTIPLRPGAYQYKFVVDGNWMEDPENPAKTSNGYGGYNSCITITYDGRILFNYSKDAVLPKYIKLNKEEFGPPLYLIIYWHMHQPMYFKDTNTGDYMVPWVRLHGIKDYYDMAALLEEYPKIHCTINLTPSLLMQLQDIVNQYEKGAPTDTYLRLTLKSASLLTYEDKEFLLKNFFNANQENMIDIYPRYRELMEKRIIDSKGNIDIPLSIKNYTIQDFRDLQAWFNLTWFDPCFKSDVITLLTGKKVTIKPYIEKGSNFTERDKKQIIDMQFEILKSIIPLYEKLQAAGQIELTTTPFYHPILPLLYDNGMEFSYPQDAAAQIDKAIALYTKIFDCPPSGMWPAEGAVSKDIIPLFQESGIAWIASGEEILAKSLGKGFVSDDDKFRAYKAIYNGRHISIIFRDTKLSNNFWFKYSQLPASEAVDDFIKQLYLIYREFVNSATPHVVAIIMDGENPWEHYQNDGREFLTSLYDQLSRVNWIELVTVSEYLRRAPPKQSIENLCAGSWIGGNFDPWIGESEENMAWKYLKKVRKDIEEWNIVTPQSWEAMYAAEASDWFWWYGKDQDSNMDRLWDEMYRKTLSSVYTFAGKQVPKFLEKPIIEE